MIVPSEGEWRQRDRGVYRTERKTEIGKQHNEDAEQGDQGQVQKEGSQEEERQRRPRPTADQENAN